MIRDKEFLLIFCSSLLVIAVVDKMFDLYLVIVSLLTFIILLVFDEKP